MNLYNIYCDESCHLEHDGINVMVLGAVWCQQTKLKEVNRRIRDIKVRNGVSPTAEMKWTKLSPAMVQLYTDLVNYFSCTCRSGQKKTRSHSLQTGS